MISRLLRGVAFALLSPPPPFGWKLRSGQTSSAFSACKGGRTRRATEILPGEVERGHYIQFVGHIGCCRELWSAHDRCVARGDPVVLESQGGLRGSERRSWWLHDALFVRLRCVAKGVHLERMTTCFPRR